MQGFAVLLLYFWKEAGANWKSNFIYSVLEGVLNECRTKGGVKWMSNVKNNAINILRGLN